MIILDTHIWVRWVENPEHLRAVQMAAIADQENDNNGMIGICATSLWEIAKLVELGRIQMDTDLADWFGDALAYPKVRVIGLSPAIAIQSTQLPRNAQLPPNEQIRDPSDQIIVATAMLNKCPLVTSDSKIIAYPDVQTIH